MKRIKFYTGFLGLAVLAACSSEMEMPDQNPIQGEGEPRYMSVSIRNTDGGTRTGGDQTTKPGGTFEEGYDCENEVKSLRFYFFDQDGNPVVINGSGNSFFECRSEDLNVSGPDMDNTVEKVLSAVIVINSADKNADKNIKKIMAVANYKSIEHKLRNDARSRNLSISDLQKVVGNETETNVAADADNGFLMTSSSYVDGTTPVCAVEISENNIQTSRELAQQFPVDVYVERVVAKIRVKTNWNSTFSANVVKDVKFADGYGYEGTYEAVALKTQNGDNITYRENGVDKQIYAVFTGWNAWWTADRSYLIKRISNWGMGSASTDLGDWWNSTSFHRSYWAENPADVVLQKYPHTHATKKILTSGSYSETKLADYVTYCLENAAEAGNNGFKKTYDPDLATTNRTLVYFGTVLVSLDNNRVATPLKLAEWASRRGPVDNVMEYMFEPIQNRVFFKSKDPVSGTSGSTVLPDGTEVVYGTDNYAYIAVRVSDIHLVSGTKAIDASESIENSPRYLSYINLKDDALTSAKTLDSGSIEIDGKLYLREDGVYSEISLDEVNSLYETVGGAKVWSDGAAYYYKDISHINATNNDPEGKKGQFGVVRNHIYEVELNSVFGLGTPVLTPEDPSDPNNWEKIIPQRPSSEFFLGARMNILSWRLVNNNISLDW